MAKARGGGGGERRAAAVSGGVAAAAFSLRSVPRAYILYYTGGVPRAGATFQYTYIYQRVRLPRRCTAGHGPGTGAAAWRTLAQDVQVTRRGNHSCHNTEVVLPNATELAAAAAMPPPPGGGGGGGGGGWVVRRLESDEQQRQAAT